MNETGKVKVWDPLVRMFHWSLVGAFTAVYLAGEDWMSVHAAAGYTILGLVLFRILWGFVGPRYARFSSFVRPVPAAVAYLKDVFAFRARRHLGHNPAGGLMIILLLASLLVTALTGVVVYGIEDQAGPLAGLMSGAGERWEDVFEELHEFLANFTLLLVGIHIGGVLVESFIHRENLIRAMFDGYKRVLAHGARNA